MRVAYGWARLGSDGTLSVSFGALGALTGGVGTYAENLQATFSVTSVREPSRYAMMLAGLGAVGIVAPNGFLLGRSFHVRLVFAAARRFGKKLAAAPAPRVQRPETKA